MQEKEAALKLELADARLQQTEAEAQRHAQAAASYRQQYEEAADIVADMGKKYEGFEQGIKQNMEARLLTYPGPEKHALTKPQSATGSSTRRHQTLLLNWTASMRALSRASSRTWRQGSLHLIRILVLWKQASAQLLLLCTVYRCTLKIAE